MNTIENACEMKKLVFNKFENDNGIIKATEDQIINFLEEKGFKLIDIFCFLEYLKY